MAKDKRSSLLGSLDQAASLAKGAYEADVALPNEHDNDAQMFSEFSKQFSAPNDRPRGIARNIGAGLMTGLASGSRSKGTEERQKKLGKYQKETDYLQKINQELIKQNQWHEQQQMRMETIKPFAIGGLEVSYSGMDYPTGNERMRNIMEQAKLADPSIKGDYVGYIPNSPIVNMRDKDGNITAFSLSSIVGEDVVKRVQGNYIDEMKTKKDFSLRQDDLDIKKFEKGIPGGKFGTQSESQDNPYGSIPIKVLGGKGMAPFMQTINAEINIAKDIPIIMHEMDKAEKIITSNPQLGSWWANVAGKNDFLKGIGLTKKTRGDYEKVDKIASRIAESFIKAKQGAISESERDIIKLGLFKVSNSAEGNKYNINAIRQELKIAKERGNFAAQQLKDGYIATAGSFDEYMESKKMKGKSNPPAEDAHDDVWNQIGKPLQ